MILIVTLTIMKRMMVWSDGVHLFQLLKFEPLKLIGHTTHNDTGGFWILTTNSFIDNVNPCLSPCHVSKDVTLPNEEPKLNVLEPALEPVACI